MAEKHEIESVARRVIDTLNTHDVDAIREMSAAGEEEWAPWGRAFTAFFAAFPDYHATVNKIIVGDDAFAIFYTVHATHTAEFPAGELKGIAGTGKALTWEEAVWQQVTPDGRLGDGGLVIAGQERLRQLGVLPESGNEFPD